MQSGSVGGSSVNEPIVRFSVISAMRSAITIRIG